MPILEIQHVWNKQRIFTMGRLFFLVLFLLTSNAYAGRLTSGDWKQIISIVQDYVTTTDIPTLCRNESGFYRADVERKIDIPGVKKVRVNYWPDDFQEESAPNSIHDHSSYFESYIIRGGYVHTVYKLGDGPHAVPVDIYKCSKRDRELHFMGKARMDLIDEQQTVEGESYSYPVSVIHRVEHAVPGTITINVIFDDVSNKDYILLFPLEGTSVDEIEASRPVVPNKDYHVSQLKAAF